MNVLLILILAASGVYVVS